MFLISVRLDTGDFCFLSWGWKGGCVRGDTLGIPAIFGLAALLDVYLLICAWLLER